MKLSSVLISCVPIRTSHPSSRYASKFICTQGQVLHLFSNARSCTSVIKDSFLLLKNFQRARPVHVYINVNGSICQFIAIVISKIYRAKVSLWIMDSYPGCLLYTTKFWLLLYLPFAIFAFFAKLLADNILVIDEAFIFHFPSTNYSRKKMKYTPIPFPGIPPSLAPRHHSSSLSIGIIGNLEATFIDNSLFSILQLLNSKDYNVLIATSKLLPKACQKLSFCEYFTPWNREDTELVFSKCSSILIPLSAARLRYSSPSKIIDCYLRGLQPVILTDHKAWIEESHRKIYKYCITFDQFLSGIFYTSAELINYGSLWLSSDSI